MTTTINQSLDVWVLCISQNEQVIKTFTVSRLLEAIDLASTLQLHVDNIADLPVGQYIGGIV